MKNQLDVASESPANAPRVFESGIVCDTPQSIARFRAIAVLHALKLESLGMKASRGISALAVARRDYSIQARTIKKAIVELEAVLVERGIILRDK